MKFLLILWILIIIIIIITTLSSTLAIWTNSDEPKLVAIKPTIGQKVRYDGDQVFRFHIENEQQIRLLEKLAHWYQDRLSFWKRTAIINETIDIHVKENWLAWFQEILPHNKMRFNVRISNVQRLIERTERFNERSRIRATIAGDVNASVVGHFVSHDDINTWLDSVCKTYPTLAKCGLGGITFQTRQIKFIRLGALPKAGNVTKHNILIFGGIHAREWLSPATLIHIINKFVTTYNSDDDVRKLLDLFDWYILPVINPDGYEYTRSDDRLWRKTRSKLAGTTCIGVDGNRNFGFHWSADNSPCSDEYSGPQAFSEVETASMSDFVKTQKIDKLLAFFSIHTYSKLWMLPFGYKANTKPSDYKELLRVGQIGTKALMAVNNERWRCGNIVDELYVAAGNTVDWFKGTGTAKYSYVLELRGDGFVVPETEIDPSGHEVFAGITAAVAAMKTDDS